MATVEEFILRFKTVGTEGIKAAKEGLSDLKTDIAAFGQAGGPLANTINGIIGKLGPLGLAAGAAGAAFVSLGSKAVTLAAEISDIAGATGITAGALLNFRTSVIEAGGKAEDFATIASKLNQSLQEAAGGNEKLQDAFRTLGVFVTDASGNIRNTEAVLKDLTDKFRSGEITGKEYAAAIDILGKNINKLELAKLQALADPVKDAEIKKLDQYSEAIDRIRDKLERGILTFFGQAAQQAEDAFTKIDAYYRKIEDEEKKLNERGRTSRAFTPDNLMTAPPGSGIPFRLGGREMSAAERAILDRQRFEADMERRMSAYRPRPNDRAPGVNPPNTPAGGFGATPEATLKAIADSRKRIAQSDSETRRQIELSTANDIQKIEINAKYEAAKARIDIENQERLNSAQKAAEYAAKEKEIFAKRDADIAKARRDLNARIAAEELQLAEQNARELAQYYQQIDQARLSAFEQVDALKKANQEQSRRAELELQVLTLSEREARNKRELLDLEEQRLKQLQAIAKIQDLPYNERLAKEKEINDEFDKQRVKITDRQSAERDASRSFQNGWTKAYNDYLDSSQNAFETAGRLFSKITGGMEDAIVGFAKTGKFEFRGFLSSILEELLRSQVRQLIAQLFGATSGSTGGLFGGKIIPGFLASGGPAVAGRPYIVGEKGPELFVPNNSGTVVPNGQFGSSGATMITYNINAVDTNSFKQLVARDPGFIYAVTEQGRRAIPQSRR